MLVLRLELSKLFCNHVTVGWVWCCGQLQQGIQNTVASILAIMERWDGSDTVTSLKGQFQWIIQTTCFVYFSCIAYHWTVYLVLACSQVCGRGKFKWSFFMLNSLGFNFFLNPEGMEVIFFSHPLVYYSKVFINFKLKL